MNWHKGQLTIVGPSSVLTLKTSLPDLQLQSDFNIQAQNGSLNHEKSLVIGISADSQKIALCTDKKELEVYKLINGELTRDFTSTVVKRPSKIMFVDDSGDVVIIDKAGDAYKVDGNTKVSALLLGHTSMLFDVALGVEKKYILTADRDEKIRISHYPNSYNIHGYCLGHREFITSICLVPGFPRVFVSGSGDGTIAVWDMEKCEALQTKSCQADLGIDATERTLVKMVLIHQGNILAVSENPDALSIYSCNIRDDDAEVQLLASQRLSSHVARAIAVEDSVLLLTGSETEPLQRFTLENGALLKTDLKVPENLIPTMRDAAKLLYQDLSQFYHKKIDNASEYQKRKEERLKGKRRDSGTEKDVKRLKSE